MPEFGLSDLSTPVAPYGFSSPVYRLLALSLAPPTIPGKGTGVPMWKLVVGSDNYVRFFRRLNGHEQAVLVAALDQVLRVHGISICQGAWGKPLGKSLYEFRVRVDLRRRGNERRTELEWSGPRKTRVLLRVFCSFRANQSVVLLGGYNKANDSSTKKQQREIARARKALAQYREESFKNMQYNT